MAQSLEDEEIRQEEIRQKEIKIAEMEQRIAVLQQRQRLATFSKKALLPFSDLKL